MQFTYHEQASENNIKISGDLHKYLFKIRRQDSKQSIYLRNLIDQNIYEYKILNINKNDTSLELISKLYKEVLPYRGIHLAWCVIDPKNIEKNIASLNEIGVNKITFIKCKYSQNKYKINYVKLNKLLINSSCQCGRSNIIQLDEIDSFENFIKIYPNTFMFNFSSNNILNQKDNIITPDYGISVAKVYKADAKHVAKINGSGGISPMGAGKDFRSMEAIFAQGWYDGITADMFQ